MGKLLLSEVFINKDKDAQFGESEPYESWTDNPGKLFRTLAKEYGRCVSSVYNDSGHRTRRIGWVFEKRMRYEDTLSNRPEGFYTREVWVTLHDAEDTVTRTVHYHELGKAV